MNKNEQNRLVAWRLRVLRQADAVPRGVAQTCRHYGLSRQTFYKWKAGHKRHGEAGLCEGGMEPRGADRACPRLPPDATPKPRFRCPWTC
jgi:transposase-like protein